MKITMMLTIALALEPAVGAVDFVDGNSPNSLKVELGKMLFHDKELSGKRNISCATCHHALADTGDGLSLPVGEGGVGLGVTRDTGSGVGEIHERVPRNAPPVFMLGSVELTKMFYDGRAQVNEDFPSGVESPAGGLLPKNLENIVAVQAMFPVTSGAEMAGQAGENRVANAAASGDVVKVWRLLAKRLRKIPEYVDLFKAAFDDVNKKKDITYAHAANAIAAFEIDAWRANASPYDAYLAGDNGALNAQELAGMKLFFGDGDADPGCSSCHNGDLLSDVQFHAIAMPQIGPGKGDGATGHEDFGREQVTGSSKDRFKFRTPPLRNVALTAPYGHAGAHDTLEEVVQHHLDPVGSLEAYDCASMTVELPLPSRTDLDAIDCVVMENDPAVEAIAAANELKPIELTDEEVSDLIAFLHALTDKSNIDLRRDVPKYVPSQIPLAE